MSDPSLSLRIHLCNVPSLAMVELGSVQALEQGSLSENCHQREDYSHNQRASKTRFHGGCNRKMRGWRSDKEVEDFGVHPSPVSRSLGARGSGPNNGILVYSISSSKDSVSTGTGRGDPSRGTAMFEAMHSGQQFRRVIHILRHLA